MVEPGLPGEQGEGVRGGGGPVADQVGDGSGGHRGVGGVPLLDHPPVLGRVEHVDRAEPGVGVGGESGQDADQVAGDPLDGVPVEQVGGGDQRAAHPGRRAVRVVRLGEADVQVELGRHLVGRERLGGQLGQPGRGIGAGGQVLQGEQHLEQRVPGQRAGRGQLLDQPLERHVLVGVRVQGGLPHPGQQLRHGRVAGQVGAHHQGVDEEPDEVVQPLVGAPGHGRADRHVGAGAEPGQHHREGGLHGHEHRHPGRAGQPDQVAVQPGGHVDLDQVPPVRGLRRAGPVGGQLQFLGRAGQHRPPVGDLPGHGAVRVVLGAEQLALPERVVGVLDRQRGPVGGPTGAAGRVRGGDVPGQRAHRPTVRGDVVHHQHEHVLVRGDGEEGDPQRHLGGQVERVRGGLGHPGGQLGPAHLDHLDPDAGLRDRQHPLVRLAVGDLVDGAQHLVPVEHVPHRRVQRGPVQVAGEAQRHRDVVGGARPLELAEEPQPALREGERHPRRPGPGGQRDPAGPRVA
ncbi:hypothetical protein B0E53_01722 [Micromonospora sp. MH33]|nr:hypothetical protein B0E53_01722 [Micromonospora sp. MH33]